MSSRPLRVCLDARLEDGVAGGIQQFIMGLAAGLSRLDGPEEYLFLSDPAHRAWLTPHLSGACRAVDAPAVVRRPAPAASGGVARAAARRVLAGVMASPLGSILPVRVPASDGTIERNAVDLMHFTVQTGFRTAIPSIYQPYDLQHVHLPQFFTPYARHMRDVIYGELSAAARSVVVMSSWVKDDVVRALRLPPEKVRVIPWAPVTEEYGAPSPDDLARTRSRLGVPEAFALYPAQTFPHKNHLALVAAVEAARRRGADLHVVCPGTLSDHHARIAREIERHQLAGRISFPGYVTPLELRCLYRLARFLVFPSLFEGGGMPVFEAYAAGLPVTCSDVTCLPKQAGDAALLFDPADPEQMADAMIRLWKESALRAELVRRGTARVARFTWDRTARTYRALYRQIAGRPLGADDREILAAPADT